MKIALVNLDLGYPIDFWPSKKQSIGMGYIAAVLQQAGHDVKLMEERFSSLLNIVNILETESFEIVGFNFIGLELSRDYLAAKTIKEAFNNPLTRIMKLVRNTYPDTLIVAGGYSATFWDEEILQLTPVDVVVRGEGELPMLQLAEAKQNGLSYEKVSSISWLSGNFLRRTSSQLINLDLLPPPIRLEHNPSDWLMMNSSRGCYARCSFCSTFALYGEKRGNWWRGRKPWLVVEEIADAHEKGFHNIQFADDDFIGINTSRALSIAQDIINKGLEVKLRFDTRVNEVEESLFKFFKEAGLKRVYIGCETGSDRDLKLFRKGITVEQSIRAVKLVKSLDIEVNAGIIMFHPYSTLETLTDNLVFIEKIEDEPALIQLASEMFIYKGTPIYREMLKKGLFHSPLTNYYIYDPAARWVHDRFYEYAKQVQTELTKQVNQTYRSGDLKREVVYQTSDNYSYYLKQLIKEAKRIF